MPKCIVVLIPFIDRRKSRHFVFVTMFCFAFSSCYLALGEVKNASKFFMKCLQQGPEVCADRKILVEASEGLEKTQVK